MAVKRLIESIFEVSEYEFVVPNYLIRFVGDVRSITVGRVRAVLTQDFADNYRVRFPKSRLSLGVGARSSPNWSGSPIELSIEMPPVAWIVTVSASKQNVEEEATLLQCDVLRVR